MEFRKFDGSLSDKLIECARFPKFSGTGILGIDGKLWGYQDRIDPRSRNLRWHLLSIKNIASEHRAMSVEENYDNTRACHVKLRGDVKENLTFAISFILPIYPSKPRAMAFSFTGRHIQKSGVRAGQYTVEGKWCSIKVSQRCLCPNRRFNARWNLNYFSIVRRFIAIFRDGSF